MSAGDRTTPSDTVTRKPDEVGAAGTPAAGGGGHTAAQSTITDMGTGGLSDSERQTGWPGDAAGDSPALGGSSGGQSDRKAAAGSRTGETVAAGHAKAEREAG